MNTQLMQELTALINTTAFVQINIGDAKRDLEALVGQLSQEIDPDPKKLLTASRSIVQGMHHAMNVLLGLNKLRSAALQQIRHLDPPAGPHRELCACQLCQWRRSIENPGLGEGVDLEA